MKAYSIFFYFFLLYTLQSFANETPIYPEQKNLCPLSFQRIQWVHHTRHSCLYLNQLRWNITLPSPFSHFEIYNKKTSQLVGIIFVKDTCNTTTSSASYVFNHASPQSVQDYSILACESSQRIFHLDIPTPKEQVSGVGKIPLENGHPLYAEAFDAVLSMDQICSFPQDPPPLPQKQSTKDNSSDACSIDSPSDKGAHNILENEEDDNPIDNLPEGENNISASDILEEEDNNPIGNLPEDENNISASDILEDKEPLPEVPLLIYMWGLLYLLVTM